MTKRNRNRNRLWKPLRVDPSTNHAPTQQETTASDRSTHTHTHRYTHTQIHTPVYLTGGSGGLVWLSLCCGRWCWCVPMIVMPSPFIQCRCTPVHFPIAQGIGMCVESSLPCLEKNPAALRKVTPPPQQRACGCGCVVGHATNIPGAFLSSGEGKCMCVCVCVHEFIQSGAHNFPSAPPPPQGSPPTPTGPHANIHIRMHR